MPQANYKRNIYRRTRATGRIYRQLDSISALFAVTAALPQPANALPPARFLIDPARDGARITADLIARPDFSQFGINAMARCVWTGSCRPDATGVCFDCGVTK